MLGVAQRSRPHGGTMAQPVFLEGMPTFGERVLRLHAQCVRKVAAQWVCPEYPGSVAPAGARRRSCRGRRPCRSITHRPHLAATALVTGALDQGFEYRAAITMAGQSEAPVRHAALRSRHVVRAFLAACAGRLGRGWSSAAQRLACARLCATASLPNSARVGRCESDSAAGTSATPSRGPCSRPGARSARSGPLNACGRLNEKGPGQRTRPFDAGPPLAWGRQYLSLGLRASGAGR